MVDVHARVSGAARDDPVDELLERDPLAVAVSPPHRLVDDLARVVAEAVAEEVLEPARGLVERVALHVEPDVARVGLGQQAEAAILLVGQELVEIAVLAAAAQLQLGLVADRLERLLRSGPASGFSRSPRVPGDNVAERLERGDPRRPSASPPAPAASPRRASGGRRPPAAASTGGGSRRSRNGRTASRTSRARRRARRGTARAPAGSTPRTRPPGTSRARRARSRRAPARPAAPEIRATCSA